MSVPPGGMIPIVVKAVEYVLSLSSIILRVQAEIEGVYSYLDATNELLGGGQSVPRPRRKDEL